MLEDVKAAKESASSGNGEDAPRRGRPPGSKSKNKASAPPPGPEMDPAVVDALLDNSLQTLAQVPIVFFTLEPPLSPEESAAVAGAAKPVLMKYLGDLLNAFGPEAALLVVCLSVYGRRSKRQSKTQPDSRNPGLGENVSRETNPPASDPFASAGPG